MGKTKIGVIAAMESEMTILKNELKGLEEVTLAGTKYYAGEIGNYRVIILQCGIGKVSAAAGAQAMITYFDPDCIINTGCAGALAPGLEIGDIVIAKSTVEWDMDLLSLGLPRGFISALNKVEIMADEKLGAMLKAAIPAEKKVVEGMVVSGDQFVDKQSQRDIIFGSFPDALCAEMEGAAIGHVCEQNEVPFCVIRAMSDTADGDSEVNFAEFSAKAGEESAAILIKMFNS